MSDLVGLRQPLPASPYLNADLAPTPLAERTWSRWHFASLWVGLVSVGIGTGLLLFVLSRPIARMMGGVR